MKSSHFIYLVLLAGVVADCRTVAHGSDEIEPVERGPHSVGSTNMEVAAQYAEIGDEAMHDFLLGRSGESGEPRFLIDLLKHPESAMITEVQIPGQPEMYGPASGDTLKVVTFLTFPSTADETRNRYAFPYHDATYGVFEDMLAPGEGPIFADADKRYPLIIISHGASAHGLYDVEHAHSLASHGYIVAVLTYGDDRTGRPGALNQHVSYLRPLLTRAVVDHILNSEDFGPHIDADNIGITGHSFGGFTALAVAGGPYQGNTATVHDPRIKAGAIAAPWVGGRHWGKDLFAFGQGNAELERVDIPVICFYGTKDDVTLASFILPAMKRLSGPTYVVELVDQPHVFEPGSWQDRNAWELLFFNAYLKDDRQSLATLQTAQSAKGGNEDYQRLEYQRTR